MSESPSAIGVALLLVLIMFLAFVLRSQKYIERRFSSAIILLCVLWYLTPIFLGIVFWDQMGKHPVTYETFARYSLLECSGLAICLLAFTIIAAASSHLGARGKSPELFSLGPEADKIIWISSAFAVLLQTYFTYGASYSEINARANSQSDREMGIAGVASFGMVCAVGIIIAYLTSDTKSEKRPVTQVVAWGTIAYITISGLLSGSRVQLLLPVVIMVLAASGKTGVKFATKMRTALLLGLLLPMAAIMTLTLGTMRNGSVTLDELLKKSFISTEQSPSGSHSISDFPAALFEKLDGVSCGAILVEKYGANVAGWAPYAGAALSVVPKLLLSSKPVPSSMDGTYSGTPPRIVARYLGMNSNTGNVGVSPLAISVWQLGTLGVEISIISSLILWILCNRLLQSRDLVEVGLGMSLMAIPVMAPLFASGDQVLMVGLRTIAALALYRFVRSIVSKTRAGQKWSRLSQTGASLLTRLRPSRMFPRF